jgi:uncharacterized protein YdaU (DUF1376 family)
MKDPAFLFYSGDFIAGVSEMTMEERGQYITLLCFQHGKGHLTMDFINRVVPNLSQYVLSKFVKDDKGLFYNKRLDLEAEKRKKYSESRSNNRKGKVKDNNIISKSYDVHMENENRNININDISIDSSSSSSSIGEKIEKKSKRTKTTITDDEYGRMMISKGFKCYGEFGNVFLSEKNVEDAIEKVGTFVLKRTTEFLSAYKETKPEGAQHYKKDYAVMSSWAFDRVKQDMQKEGLNWREYWGREMRERENAKAKLKDPLFNSEQNGTT